MNAAREIVFANGNRALVINARAEANASEILRTLGLKQPRAVLLIFGGADELDESVQRNLAQLFRDAIAPAARETGALIIDGGTESGVMTMIGQACGPGANQLLGVSPAKRVTLPASPSPERAALEPHHTHFVLVDSDEWGGETAMIFELAKATRAPVAAVLANGGRITLNEALLTARNRWPLFVLEGSGRLADELAANATSSDQMTEVNNSGCVEVFRVTDDPARLKHAIVAALSQGMRQ